jgi:DNA-binding CsgD family transcriptional regulator
VRTFEDGLGDLAAPSVQAALIEAKAWLTMASGDPSAAGERFLVVRNAWTELPRPRDAALAGGYAAEALLRAGRDDDGTTMLRQAVTELRALGASGDITRLIQRIRPVHPAAASAWRGGRHGYGNALSPRELDVVRLVAAGKTNREIARALSRATSTVANQLRSAMRKLDVTSRTAVAARAIESGLLE